ncbi:MAG: sodium:solute symport protein [Methyloceanibacter sp.]|nr:MAG: sodium:solute symport protein [Methyloceanibacter sp.]
MSLGRWDIVGVFAYFMATGVFAYLVRRTRSFAEFSVGSRKVPAAMVFASMAATYIGPGFSVGFASKGYSSGYLFYLLALTYPLQTALVAFLFAPRLSLFRDCHTIGDVIARRYGRFSQFLAGVISVGLCIGFTAVMGKIGGDLLHAVTGWPLTVSVAVVTMSTALFTFTGGVRAVIATDAVHFTWFSIVVPFVLLLAFIKHPQGADAIGARAGELTHAGFVGMSWIQMLAIAVSFLLGETLIPPYANRALAAQSEQASRTGFFLAGLYCVVWLAIVATIGVVAHGLLPPDTAADGVFLAVGRAMLPYGTYGLLLAAVIAIVMSSQESVLNSATVALTRDIVGTVFGPALADRQALIASRVGTIVIAAIAACAALYAPSIIDGLLICYSIWAPGLLLPFLLGLYLKRTTPMAGWLSMITGSASSILWQTVLREPGGVPAIFVGLAAGAVAYAVGHLIGARRDVIRTSAQEVVG